VARRLPKRQAATSAPPVTATDGLQQPSFHTERPTAPADAVLPQSTPEIAELNPEPVQERAAVTEKKLAPMRIYASTAAPEPTPEEEDLGDYAPAYRLVRCKLVNTIDSSNISTPIFGLVTDDLVWDGKVIIAKCSEVHGLAQVDKSRERIAAEGAWTFTLFESDIGRLGDRELVVKGYALDREDDPEFKALMVGAVVVDPKVKTWGITDGSAGLRGAVLKSSNVSDINLFLAAFLDGVAQSVQGYNTNIFGVVPSPNASGAGGVSGEIINPPALGLQSVLNRYCQMVMDQIEKDGFFIRVPAGKLFYVYVTEDILTGKATVGGSRRLREVQSDFLDDRDLQERVTQPRAERDAKAREEARNGFPYPPINPALTQKLDEAADRLERRSEDLQNQSQQLAQPSPTPNQPTPSQ
jgi:Bacterial conjugation TrbI-like protein